jgi:phage repressor protein C with HTH and peptisase S24 domain
MLKFKNNSLKRLRPRREGGRKGWERFVLVKVDSREGTSMYPRLMAGATVLIDRHYNSLKPYRKGDTNIYAVSKDGRCTITYVEQAGRHLVLRPHNPAYPVEIMPMEEGKDTPDYLIGRICHVGMET